MLTSIKEYDKQSKTKDNLLWDIYVRNLLWDHVFVVVQRFTKLHRRRIGCPLHLQSSLRTSCYFWRSEILSMNMVMDDPDRASEMCFKVMMRWNELWKDKVRWKELGGKWGEKTLESEGSELHRTCQTFQPQFSIFLIFLIIRVEIT